MKKVLKNKNKSRIQKVCKQILYFLPELKVNTEIVFANSWL